MNTITDQERKDVFITSKALRDGNHREVVARLVSNGATGAIVSAGTWSEWFYATQMFPQSRSRRDDEYLFPHFIEVAHEAGLKVYQLMVVGKWEYWESSLLPMISDFPETSEWNLKNEPSINADYNWLNLTRPDVREAVTDLVREAQTLLDLDGIVLDYVRFQATKSGREWEQHAHVTRLVENVRGMMNVRFPDKELLAVGMPAAAGWQKPGMKYYEIYSQRWDEWLRDGLIDQVLVMVYRRADTFRARLADLPDDRRVSIIVHPGGEGPIPAPMDAAELRMIFEMVSHAWLPFPAIWHGGLMSEAAWQVYAENARMFL